LHPIFSQESTCLYGKKSSCPTLSADPSLTYCRKRFYVSNFSGINKTFSTERSVLLLSKVEVMGMKNERIASAQIWATGFVIEENWSFFM
jgi:hypothetical protein